MTDSRFNTVVIPAGSTTPIDVEFDAPFELAPRVILAYGGTDELLDLDPVRSGDITETGFRIWSTEKLAAPLTVQWATQLVTDD